MPAQCRVPQEVSALCRWYIATESLQLPDLHGLFPLPQRCLSFSDLRRSFFVCYDTHFPVSGHSLRRFQFRIRHSFTMLSTLLALAAVPAALGQILDIPDDNRMVAEGGIIRFPIDVIEGAPVKGLDKRQDKTGLTEQKLGNFYSIELTLGTPGQAVSVNFDTGSSELWVNPDCSKANDPAFCSKFGQFTQSSTFVDLNEQGHVQYGTGYADFEYGYDYVKIGSEYRGGMLRQRAVN